MYGWVGLGWAGLERVGFWVGLGFGLGWVGVGWVGFCWVDLGLVAVRPYTRGWVGGWVDGTVSGWLVSFAFFSGPKPASSSLQTTGSCDTLNYCV